MTETELYNVIKSSLYKRCRSEDWMCHFVRIESPSSPGIPDINCCINGNEFWIECKVDNFEMSSMQASWCLHRNACGGKVFLVRYDNILKRYNMHKMGQLDSIDCIDIEDIIEDLVHKI